MMGTLQERREPVERIILETRDPQWVAFSIGGCGILTRAVVGRHETKYRESLSIASAFAHLVVQTVALSPLHNRVPTPQVLMDAADAVIDDPEHVLLLGTVWQCVSENVEICSVGLNTVLVFEKDSIREVIVPHTASTLLRSQGYKLEQKHGDYVVTHALGASKSTKSCHIDDVRVALIPLLSTTTIAIIKERSLVDAILEHTISGNELTSFLEAWNPAGKKVTTSVILSL